MFRIGDDIYLIRSDTEGLMSRLTVNWPNVSETDIPLNAFEGNVGSVATLGAAVYVLTDDPPQTGGTIRVYSLEISGNLVTHNKIAEFAGLGSGARAEAAFGLDDAIYVIGATDGAPVLRITDPSGTPAISTFGTLTPAMGSAAVLR